MSKHDIRVWKYLGILSLITSCGFGMYILIFFLDVEKSASLNFSVHPLMTFALGTVFTILNSFAVNILSDDLIKSSGKLPPLLKYSIVGGVFILSVIGTVIIAWMLSN